MYGTSSTVNRMFCWMTASFFRVKTTEYHPLLGQLKKKKRIDIVRFELCFRDTFFSLRKANTISGFFFNGKS